MATSNMERALIEALFRQEKPIIFSLKGALEKLGRGHHKTSHMNRSQHADALLNGLDKYRGQNTKPNWVQEPLWKQLLSVANLKRKLESPTLGPLWEKVKGKGGWDPSFDADVSEVIEKVEGKQKEVEVVKESTEIKRDEERGRATKERKEEIDRQKIAKREAELARERDILVQQQERMDEVDRLKALLRLRDQKITLLMDVINHNYLVDKEWLGEENHWAIGWEGLSTKKREQRTDRWRTPENWDLLVAAGLRRGKNTSDYLNPESGRDMDLEKEMEVTAVAPKEFGPEAKKVYGEERERVQEEFLKKDKELKEKKKAEEREAVGLSAEEKTITGLKKGSFENWIETIEVLASLSLWDVGDKFKGKWSQRKNKDGGGGFEGAKNERPVNDEEWEKFSATIEDADREDIWFFTYLSGGAGRDQTEFDMIVYIGGEAQNELLEDDALWTKNRKGSLTPIGFLYDADDMDKMGALYVDKDTWELTMVDTPDTIPSSDEETDTDTDSDPSDTDTDTDTDEEELQGAPFPVGLSDEGGYEGIEDLKVGGITKGHFNQEVPVILHGGELVIPKKLVDKVMDESKTAVKVSKTPPVFKKIKKIIK